MTICQDEEVTTLMKEFNALDGIGKVQIMLLTAHWQAPYQCLPPRSKCKSSPDECRSGPRREGG